MPDDLTQNEANPGTSRSLVLNTTLNDAASRISVNPIRGQNVKGSLASGIPKQVTNVGASACRAIASGVFHSLTDPCQS